MITLSKCNPYIRFAMRQETVMESDKPRIPYDHRIFAMGTALLLSMVIE